MSSGNSPCNFASKMAGKWYPHDEDFSKAAKAKGASSMASVAPKRGGSAPTAQKQPNSFDLRKIVEANNNLEFVEPLPEEFECAMCLTVMNDPLLILCGHRFCRRCLEDRIREEPDKKCPICDVYIEDSMPDKAIERKIKSLQVYCINRADGCEWTGELVSLQSHLQKNCSFMSQSSSRFESLANCEAEIGPPNPDDNKILGHMTKIVEQFDAQQKAFDDLIRKKDEKIRALEQRIAAVGRNIDCELNGKRGIKWTTVTPSYKLLLINSSTRPGVTKCRIPDSTVPPDSREIMVLLSLHMGNSLPHNVQVVIKVFVEDDGVRYTKFMEFRPYKQKAWNDNTNNVWLPMPTNRIVHVETPVKFDGDLWCDVLLVGHR